MAAKREGYDTASWAVAAMEDTDDRNRTLVEIALAAAQEHGDFDTAGEFVERIDGGPVQKRANYQLGMVATGDERHELGAAYRDTLPAGWERDELTLLLAEKAAQTGEFDRCETMLEEVGGGSRTDRFAYEEGFPFKSGAYRRIAAAAGAAGRPEVAERIIDGYLGQGYLQQGEREAGYVNATYAAARTGEFETAMRLLFFVEDSWQRSQAASAVRRYAIEAEQPAAAKEVEVHICYPGLGPGRTMRQATESGPATEDFGEIF